LATEAPPVVLDLEEARSLVNVMTEAIAGLTAAHAGGEAGKE
jgi:hypothetical protein